MSEGTDPDAVASADQQTASDPGTAPALLAEIVRLRPDLRPSVARNPSAYPGLVDWLARLSDPTVDAALAERATAPAAPAQVPPVPPAPRQLVTHVPGFETPPATPESPAVPTADAGAAAAVDDVAPADDGAKPAEDDAAPAVGAAAGVPDGVPPTVNEPPSGDAELRPADGEVPEAGATVEATLDEPTQAASNEPEQAAPEPKKATAPDRARRRRGVALLAGSVALLVIAGFAGGAVLAWTALGELQARHESADVEVIDFEAPEYGAELAVSMPDVRGLDEAAAREVLADSGVDPAAITASEREWAGPVGIVIQQTPVFGTADPDEVELLISTEARVPVVDGQESSEIIQALGALGADVEVVSQYSAGATAGTALSIEPAPGSALPELVTLVVAEPSASVFLSGLDSVEGGCSRGEYAVNGTTYANSLACRADDEPSDSAWVISRVADSFEAVIGVPDNGEPGARVRVEVLADGVVVGSAEAGYGQPAALSGPLTGALRLTVRVTLVAGADDFGSEDAVLADFRIIGGAEAMQALGEQP